MELKIKFDPKKNPIYWSDEQIETLCKLRNEDLPYTEVSKRIGRTVSACQTMMFQCRINIDRVSKRLRGWDD